MFRAGLNPNYVFFFFRVCCVVPNYELTQFLAHWLNFEGRCGAKTEIFRIRRRSCGDGGDDDDDDYECWNKATRLNFSVDRFHSAFFIHSGEFASCAGFWQVEVMPNRTMAKWIRGVATCTFFVCHYFD